MPPPAPQQSLERFLADPTPGRGAPHTGNVEMWPLPECEAALPPVGGMPPMPPAGPPRWET